ncbi:hypothetical protein VTN31DRAFT_5811 [Thermomyces dupontii]|uniref:uncharacterized protein n=1 Tax=Talaromyces thermophilus TaxID=28565 RepID=UPI0037443671
MGWQLSLSFLLAWILLALDTVDAKHYDDGADDVSRLVNKVAKANNESLLWGPYKSNLYFGVQPRIPKSIAAGLMWSRADDYEALQKNFRHTCEQSDEMAGYGWDEYDARTGGRETIHDANNQLDITIDFVKIPGGKHGGSWAARVKGTPREDAPEDLSTTVVFYATLEGPGRLEVNDWEAERSKAGSEGNIRLSGVTPELGRFMIDVTAGPDNDHPECSHPSCETKPLDKTFVASMEIPSEALWQSKIMLFATMRQSFQEALQEYGEQNLPPPERLFTVPHIPGKGNMHFVQRVFRGAFEFDILFSSKSAPVPVTSETLTKRIQSNAKSFSKNFDKAFSRKSPFNTAEYTEFSKNMFSNLVGGIGYFYGSGIVDRSAAPENDELDEGFWEEAAEARERAKPEEEQPHELFTCVPSRSFFPRGFLWDEGFHLIPILDYDVELALDILKSWFSSMDEDGWIAREQILGLEARNKVPPEFRVQYPHYANPPTLFMVLELFLDKLKASKPGKNDGDLNGADRLRSIDLENRDLALAHLRSLYPLLKRQYFWFRRTQWGDVKSYDREAYSTKEAYRWRGRTVMHILTSGFDDYPRAQPPHPGELHVDLISWVGMMTRALRRVASVLGKSDDAEEFAGYEDAIKRNIVDLHWNDAAQTFCDATIDEYEESVHVCHKGYVSLMPFLAGMLAPDSPQLKPVLDLIGDSAELWSDYGIRSLSKKDPNYGKDENYWRSPIWININYMILKSLFDVGTTPGPHQSQARQLYSSLRKNVVNNVFREWKRTGYAWEQYNPDTGNGQRTQHFTGWTSLVVKIMAMDDLPAAAGHDEL